MGFSPPVLGELISRAPQVKMEYIKHGTLERDRIVDIFDAITQFVTDIQKESFISEEMLQAFFIGAWWFCIEKTDSKSLFFSADRSTLHAKLKEKLSISENNMLDDKTKLEYLSAFFKLTFKEESLLRNKQGQSLVDFLQEQKIERSEVLAVMKPALTQTMAELVRMCHGIPTESAITEKMLVLPERYKQRKKEKKSGMIVGWFSYFSSTNPNRYLYAQLSSAMAGVLKKREYQTPDLLSERLAYTLRIKLGLLLYIQTKIGGEYWARSESNSDLFDDVNEGILNGQGLHILGAEMQHSCLTACRDFLSNDKNLADMEAYAIETYQKTSLLYPINSVANGMREDLNGMIKVLSIVPSSWPATATLSQVGSYILAAPGYGVGYVLGYNVSELITATPTSAASVVSHTAAALVGMPTASAGVFLPNFIIQSTLTRAFATVLEGLGKLIGYTSGGLIGLTFDLSYKGLKQLCGCFLHVYNHSQLSPALMQNIDPKLIQCMIDLPEELFGEAKKEELEQTLAEHAPEKKAMTM